MLQEICLFSHLVYNICNPNGLKLLTRLRLGLSHLNEDRFNHNFEGCITLCALVIWRLSHYFTSSCTVIAMTLSDLMSDCKWTWTLSHLKFRFSACFEQQVLDIQATIECGFTLKHKCDMRKTYSQISWALWSWC